MSDLAKGYVVYLKTKATVTGVCSTRITYDELPQRTALPAVVIHDLGGVTERHLGGSTEHARSRLQADCYATTHAAANNLAKQVRLVTENYSGAWDTETITHAMSDRAPQSLDAPAKGSETSRRVATLDLIVHHTETAPTT